MKPTELDTMHPGPREAMPSNENRIGAGARRWTGMARRRVATILGLALAAAGAAEAQVTPPTIGTSFPPGFRIFNDASLGTPVIGFGGEGRAVRTPVIFLHDNDDTPYHDITTCGRWGVNLRAMAQYLANYGYAASELWALGYQGNQCDRIDTPTVSSSLAHTITANVPDLRRFVKAVLASTGAEKVDIVGHGMGATLAREWVRQDDAQKLVRRFVSIDGPNNGMIICSAHPQNPWRSPFAGGFTPTTPVCQEIGSPETPFLKLLNKGSARVDPRDTLVIRNSIVSFPFMSAPDGLLGTPMPTPVVDSYGNPADFSQSPTIKRAADAVIDGQAANDKIGGTAHVGIANSTLTWQTIFGFLSR